MTSSRRRDDAGNDDESRPRLVAGKPYRIEGDRLVKLGLEDWEIEGRPWPALDDHLLEPGQPWELVGGRLIARHMPEIEEIRDEGRAEGRLALLAELVAQRLARALSDDERARLAAHGDEAELASALLAPDTAALERWLATP